MLEFIVWTKVQPIFFYVRSALALMGEGFMCTRPDQHEEVTSFYMAASGCSQKM